MIMLHKNDMSSLLGYIQAGPMQSFLYEEEYIKLQNELSSTVLLLNSSTIEACIMVLSTDQYS